MNDERCEMCDGCRGKVAYRFLGQLCCERCWERICAAKERCARVYPVDSPPPLTIERASAESAVVDGLLGELTK